ncbi:MAG: hypothetical protein K9L70_07890 [Thiohalocapsa sp.]|nr:hypothetical protein [Thiohalocapsa sp.]MCF7991586.1 hypothetical protein [Thiohalocapsa sp.]
MTKTTIALAALIFTAGAQASDSYRQFTAGNPDSSTLRGGYHGITAVQPSVGADFDRYHSLGEGNPDLFSVDLGASRSNAGHSSELPEIYGPFGMNPDLSY